MRYSKAPEQPQNSARPICHSNVNDDSDEDGARTSHHTHCCIGALSTMHCTTGDNYSPVSVQNGIHAKRAKNVNSPLSNLIKVISTNLPCSINYTDSPVLE